LEPGKRAQVVALVLRASSTMAPLARAPTDRRSMCGCNKDGIGYQCNRRLEIDRKEKEQRPPRRFLPGTSHAHFKYFSGQPSSFLPTVALLQRADLQSFRKNSTGLITC
jgi:hypothetical protein